MSLSDRLNDLTGLGDDDSPQPNRHPSGWEPGIEMHGNRGAITTFRPVRERPTSWDDLLRVWDLDPAEYEVVEPVQYRAWDGPIGSGKIHRFYYYRATIRTRRPGGAEVDELIERVRRHRPPKRPAPTGDLAWLYASGDLQAGKGEGGGSAAMVERYLTGLDGAVARLRELRRDKRPIGDVVLPWVGDCIEHVRGHYAMQTFSVDLTLTEQVRLIRRLMFRQITTFARLADRVIVPVVPGNHDEAIRDSAGKSVTSFMDSWAIEAAAGVQDILELGNPEAYGHVHFLYPDPEVDPLTRTVDIAGTLTGFAHGHQFGRDIERWWDGQAGGMTPIGRATLLVAGHKHHLRVDHFGRKTFVQVPSLDGGSMWFHSRTGKGADPGVVTMTVGAGKWGDLAVL